MVPLLLFFGLALTYAFRDRYVDLKQKLSYAKVVFLAGFVIAFAWLGFYFIQHPKSFVGRAGEVSIFNKDLNNGDVLGTFIMVVKKTLLSFFTQGDLNFRHNVAGFPFLSLFISPFFAIVLIIFSVMIFKFLYDAYKKQVNPQTVYKALLASWFWAMLLPEVTTAEAIPHGLRLIGVIPPIFILAAFGVNKLWIRIKKLFPSIYSRFTFVSSFLGLILIYNFYLVFGVAAKSSDFYYAYRSDLTVVSDYLNQRNLKNKTYLSLDEYSLQTVEYLTTTALNPYQVVDPAHSFEVKLNKGDEIVFTQSTIYDTYKFNKFHKDARLIRTDKNQWGEIIMEVYEK
jgi:hypothetical protein